MGVRRVVAGCCAALGLLFPAAAPASGRVARAFVGMNLSGPALSSPSTLRRSFAGLAATDVGSVRVVFNWSAAQPYPNWGGVPVAQFGDFLPLRVPTTFAATDEVVGLAAGHHMTVLPSVLYTPAWDQQPHTPPGAFAIPRSPRPYGDYLRLLVQRYGPRGSFWRDHPRLPREPIRMWQIWNEPNVYGYWPSRGSYAPGYVALLRAAHAAIKQADPGAKVVLAGMPNYTWLELAKIYRAGGRGLFDVVAVHPYTKTPQGVITLVRLVRQQMDRWGDRSKGIMLTELGWPSSLGHTVAGIDFETTERGQAQKLAAVLPMLARVARSMKLLGFYYYTWESTDTSLSPWDYSGLLTVHSGQLTRKPAYRAFRRTVRTIES